MQPRRWFNHRGPKPTGQQSKCVDVPNDPATVLSFPDPGWGGAAARCLRSSGLPLHEESHGITVPCTREAYQSEDLSAWCRKWGQSSWQQKRSSHSTSTRFCALFSRIRSKICDEVIPPHPPFFFHIWCIRSSSWGGPATPGWNMWTLTVCSAVWVYARSSESLPLCCWSVESSLWLINSGEAED